MNDPNKRIDVNLSSLLSLKAELLRKQSEVTKAKSTHVIKNFQQTIKPKQKKNDKKSEKKTIGTGAGGARRHEEIEDSATLEKSKRILEAKSKYYDRMCALGGTVNSEDTSLVMFNQKKQTNSNDSIRNRQISSSSDDDDDINNKYNDDDKLEEGWVEYTDCLGRTRKCLIEDLEYFKKKDSELVDTVTERMDINKESTSEQNTKLSTSEQSELFKQPIDLPRNIDDNRNIVTGSGGNGGGDDSVIGFGSGDNDDDTMSILSKTSKIEEMRTNWDRQEAENADKEFVHYQDILFDEARTHGVGYYQFSTDDLERTKQRDQLDELREKTLDAQKKREEQRQARASIVEQRVRAAKNRQRARLGLPPLEDEPPVPKEPEKSTETVADIKSDKKSRKEKRKLAKKEAEERRRIEEREQHIRPWDKGKDGVSKSFNNRSNSDDDDDEDDDSRSPSPEWSYKPEKEPMSQEKWNEIQRNERKNEFAPPSSLKQQQYKDKPSYHTVRPPPPPQIPPPHIRRQPPHPPPPLHQQFHQPAANTTSTTTDHSFRENKTETRKRKPFVVRPIDDEEDNNDERIVNSRSGAEIPPPPTFDYYGPSSSKYPKSNRSVKPELLENSIAAGLKFLREQSDKGAHTTKQKWTTTQDY